MYSIAVGFREPFDIRSDAKLDCQLLVRGVRVAHVIFPQPKRTPTGHLISWVALPQGGLGRLVTEKVSVEAGDGRVSLHVVMTDCRSQQGQSRPAEVMVQLRRIVPAHLEVIRRETEHRALQLSRALRLTARSVALLAATPAASSAGERSGAVAKTDKNCRVQEQPYVGLLALG